MPLTCHPELKSTGLPSREEWEAYEQKIKRLRAKNGGTLTYRPYITKANFTFGAAIMARYICWICLHRSSRLPKEWAETIDAQLEIDRRELCL